MNNLHLTTTPFYRLPHVETLSSHHLRVLRASAVNSLVHFSLAIALSACSSLKPLKGGKATSTGKPGGMSQTLVQSENPSQPSRQEQETIKVRTYALPIPPFSIENPVSSIQNPASNIQPLLVSDLEQTRAKTELGAAQKDTGRDLAAKLSSLKGIVWIGVFMFIFGIASAFWPPLKVIIGSLTTSAAIAAGGLALIFLPTLIVGHELLLMGGVVLVVAAWFLAHRHGRLHGELSTRSASPNF